MKKKNNNPITERLLELGQPLKKFDRLHPALRAWKAYTNRIRAALPVLNRMERAQANTVCIRPATKQVRMWLRSHPFAAKIRKGYWRVNISAMQIANSPIFDEIAQSIVEFEHVARPKPEPRTGVGMLPDGLL